VLLTLVWIAFLCFCLYMAGSRGAQLAAVLGIGGLVFSRIARRLQNVLLFLTALVSIPLAALAFLTFSANSTELSVFGLTFDTSSRTQIWSYGLQLLPGRELFGFGPSGFWTPERSDVFKANNGWVLDNFHSGYVTTLIEGGVVGLLLLLGALLATFAHLRREATGGDRYITFAFAFFCIVVAQNLVENTFGRSTDFQFFTLLLFVFAASAVRPRFSRAIRTATFTSPRREAIHG
jgi:O-antigen ligase